MINENISTRLKRRLNYDSLKNDIQIIMEYELSFHDYNIGEYISEVCSWEVNNILDDMFNEHNITLQPKDKDKLYHFLVDNFGEMIAEYYKNNNRNLKESVKKYIVTESQLNRVIPVFIKRRLDEIDDALYEMLYNTDIGTAVGDYDREDYIVYVVEYLYDEYFLNLETSGGEYEALKSLFGNRIGEYWDNYHDKYAV